MELVTLSKVMIQLLRYPDSPLANARDEEGFVDVSVLLAHIRLKIKPPGQSKRAVERGDILTVAAQLTKNGVPRFEAWWNQHEAYIRAVERRSASTARPRDDKSQYYRQLSKAMARILRYRCIPLEEGSVHDTYLSLGKLAAAIKEHHLCADPVPIEDILLVVNRSTKQGMHRFQLQHENSETFIRAVPRDGAGMLMYSAHYQNRAGDPSSSSITTFGCTNADSDSPYTYALPASCDGLVGSTACAEHDDAWAPTTRSDMASGINLATGKSLRCANTGRGKSAVRGAVGKNCVVSDGETAPTSTLSLVKGKKGDCAKGQGAEWEWKVAGGGASWNDGNPKEMKSSDVVKEKLTRQYSPTCAERGSDIGCVKDKGADGKGKDERDSLCMKSKGGKYDGKGDGASLIMEGKGGKSAGDGEGKNACLYMKGEEGKNDRKGDGGSFSMKGKGGKSDGKGKGEGACFYMKGEEGKNDGKGDSVSLCMKGKGGKSNGNGRGEGAYLYKKGEEREIHTKVDGAALCMKGKGEKDDGKGKCESAYLCMKGQGRKGYGEGNCTALGVQDKGGKDEGDAAFCAVKGQEGDDTGNSRGSSYSKDPGKSPTGGLCTHSSYGYVGEEDYKLQVDARKVGPSTPSSDRRSRAESVRQQMEASDRGPRALSDRGLIGTESSEHQLEETKGNVSAPSGNEHTSTESDERRLDETKESVSSPSGHAHTRTGQQVKEREHNASAPSGHGHTEVDIAKERREGPKENANTPLGARQTNLAGGGTTAVAWSSQMTEAQSHNVTEAQSPNVTDVQSAHVPASRSVHGATANSASTDDFRPSVVEHSSLSRQGTEELAVAPRGVAHSSAHDEANAPPAGRASAPDDAVETEGTTRTVSTACAMEAEHASAVPDDAPNESHLASSAAADAVMDGTTHVQEPASGKFVVVFDFDGAEWKDRVKDRFPNDNYLTLKNGMIVCRLPRTDSDEWFFGYIESGQEGDAPTEGWFPPAYVQAL